MASFNTIPEVDSETTLLNKEPKPKSLRGLVAGAAAASFLLGLVAATALSATAPAPPAALHNKKLGSIKDASYLVNIACLDDTYTQLWNSKHQSGAGYYDYTANAYPRPDFGSSNNPAEDWAHIDFNYIETAEYNLENKWATGCKYFGLSVTGPDGTGDAPTWRSYTSDGVYLGSLQAGDFIDSDKVDMAVIPNLPENLKGKQKDEPWSLKTSVYLENPSSTVQSNRLLLVDISFKPNHKYADNAYKCVIDSDVKSDGIKITSGKIKGSDCKLSPPAYSCDGQTMYYKGSIRDMNDGRPIDIEFKNGATLEIPLTNNEFVYHLNYDSSECKDLCSWAQGKKDWSNSMGECWADVEQRSVGDQGLGPIKVWGFGRLTADGIWNNVGNWPGWDSKKTDGYAASVSGRDDKGEPIYIKAKDAMKANEWQLLSGMLDILQDKEYDSFDHVEYAMDVQNIGFGSPMNRGDAHVRHQACFTTTTNGDNCGKLVNDLKVPGARLLGVSDFSWRGQTDGPNLSAPYSKIDTSFLMSADDVMHVSASYYSAWKNVVVTGSAGDAINLGSYNRGLNSFDIKKAVVDGVFVARAFRTANTGGDFFSHNIGLVGTFNCANFGQINLEASVSNVIVAGLGDDDAGNQIQQVDRLFSITAHSQETWSYVCGDDGPDPSNILPPKWDITLGPFYVYENSLVEWGDYSNECNYVHNGEDDHWNVKLVGSDLKSSYDDSKNSCPWPK